MSVISDMTLLRPWWSLAALLALVFALVTSRRRKSAGDWGRTIDPHLLAAMAALGRLDTGARTWAGMAPFAAAGLIALCLTGPALNRGEGTTFRNLDGVVLVVDVSASMTRDDTWPATVTMAHAALKSLSTRPAGLIVYAGDSYVASALTTDHVQLGQTIALLEDGVVPDRGNRPALALTQAADMLSEANMLHGQVILFTDGDGLSAEALHAVAQIDDLNGRVDVVHAPTTVSPQPATSAAQLETLAAAGGGHYYTINQTAEIMADLEANGRQLLERQNFQLQLWTDYGRHLLLLALIPVALLFRRDAS